MHVWLGCASSRVSGHTAERTQEDAKEDAVTLGEEQSALSAGQGPPDPCGIPQGLDFALDKMGRDGVGWG